MQAGSGKSIVDNLGSGGTPFSSSVLGKSAYQTAYVNDGYYGDSRSWVGNEPSSWVGISLPQGLQGTLRGLAFGRDQQWVLTDRCLGGYLLL